VLEPELETSHATPRNESVKPRNGFVPASTSENPTVDLPSHPASLANPELVPRPHDQVPASRSTPQLGPCLHSTLAKVFTRSGTWTRQLPTRHSRHRKKAGAAANLVSFKIELVVRRDSVSETPAT
jgi:hypothetical protein